MKTICVCGAGTMGSGIAQVCAMAGYRTILYELNEAVLEKAKANILSSLQSLADKKRISPEGNACIFNQIEFTNDLQLCIADLVIEAVIEKPDVKVSLFNQLSEINHSETIFATNTSSLSVSEIAGGIKNPFRVAGLHFFNPAPLMKLVEVVKGEKTSEFVVASLSDFALSLGKQPVICKDSPGFIVNRVARPFYIESLRMTEEGISDVAMIDRLLEDRGFRMGPFKLMDLIGNDVNYAVSCSVYNQMGQPERLKPSYIQKEKVDSGALGRKTKKGYYDY
jgi:3-hydroxybutyryl-CoA dehydrogenase